MRSTVGLYQIYSEFVQNDFVIQNFEANYKKIVDTSNEESLSVPKTATYQTLQMN